MGLRLEYSKIELILKPIGWSFFKLNIFFKTIKFKNTQKA